MRHAFVTGATGFVGAHVARKLVERGDRVIVLARPTSNTALIDDLPVEVARGDLTDLDSLIEPMRGSDELYHVAADYRLWARDPGEIYRSNVIGTRNILEVALQSRVRRVVYTSTVGCLGLCPDGSPADETTPVRRSELVGAYKKSKYDAERIALAYAERGLNVVVVSPSTPVGPGDAKPTPTGRIILDFLRGRMFGYVDTGLNLIAVEDVADGHLLAAHRGRTGERYILGNRNMPLCGLLATLAGLTGRRPPKFRVPFALALAAASLSAAQARIRGREPGIPIEGVLMSAKKMYFRADKAVRELGLPQSPVQDALERAVRWFTENDYVKRPLV